MTLMEGDYSLSTGTTGRFAKEQADRLLGRLAVQVARTIKSHSAAEVHDLRVAIRRFSNLLVLLKPCFSVKESRKIRRKLKKIMAQAGTVRDHDIALRLVAKLVPSTSNAMASQFRTERKESAETLAVSLKRWLRRNSSAKWREALEVEVAANDFCADAIGVTGRRMLPRMAKEYFRCGKDATHDKARPEELHRFRISSKNFRYTLDLLAPLYGASVNALLQQLKEVQTLLGDVNDCATAQRMVSRHGGGRDILAELKKRQRKKTERFREHWRSAFTSEAVVRRWIENLRDVGGQVRAPRKPPARSVPLAFDAWRSISA
ncbi:MAG: CHAD domain-containing protein [Acidobacteriia bacterium]|nr:CHAD domain-containing protein [Terriglobia bacterium]